MKVLMMCRGSQGDVYPHFALAKKLTERGHDVMLNVTAQFEEIARKSGIPYTVTPDKGLDELMKQSDVNLNTALKYLGQIISRQFEYFVPMISGYDMLVAGNAEFAAPHIAEYGRKKIIRVSFAPVLPTGKFMPPLTPLVKPFLFLTIPLMWKLTNTAISLPVIRQINFHRKKFGMAPIKNQGEYAHANSFNLLMYSELLGEVDEEWNYRWDVSGYCFYDLLPYKEDLYRDFVDFIKKDEKPVLFFTVGSTNVARQQEIADWLLTICRKYGYKLIVGCNWRKTAENLEQHEDLFILDGIIPHNLVMPHCTAMIHHGGSGTTHSAARAGKPQMICSAFVDQPYWASRVKALGLGPGPVNTKKVSFEKLEKKSVDLMTNSAYKKNAAELGEKFHTENSLDKAADTIEKVFAG
ncbi:MAG: glycosyltransferase [Treponema sp.]|jgi:UDP:flavonoid glycosyltransferase YjiC (YdhE family)|nr:glycosyltransferase [Treponema sp.]